MNLISDKSTVDHTYDTCPKYSKLGSFGIIKRIFMLATVAAANIKKVQIKKYSVFIYREAEPHAMYAI